jgi:tetratricopeptide (TPR) repeat protein
MRKTHFPTRALLLLVVLLTTGLAGSELQPQLREAERLYQAGRYSEAASAASRFLHFFPDDFQALLIAGMSEYNRGNYADAKKHFTKAHSINANHPLVREYTALLREIEYRSGIISQVPLQPPESNEFETAGFYKRAYFGPAFTHTSGAVIDPALAIPQTALPTPFPPVESIFHVQPVVDIADRAFNEQNFHKSYLFYSQLLASEPGNRNYLLRKAESAFHMKRFRQVIDLLGPLLAAPTIQGFDETQIKKARQLLSDARQKISIGKF